ncbi:photosystem II reaction center protein T [Leptolyngbya sp. AN02str]
MESVIYVLLLIATLGLLFFAIAFREPPRITKKDE